MADYKHGSMDVSVQERTFATFVSWITKGSIVCVLLLIFLALVNG